MKECVINVILRIVYSVADSMADSMLIKNRDNFL